MVYKLPPLPGLSPPSSPLKPSESKKTVSSSDSESSVIQSPPSSIHSSPSSQSFQLSPNPEQLPLESVQDNNAMDVDAPQEHYHLNPASESHTLWERRALLFANPTLWSPIPDDLPLPAPKGWLESSLIDCPPEAHTVPEEIKAKWESLIPPQQQTSLLQHPQITTHAAFGVQQANHWFTVIFDHTFQSVYVFNRIFLNTRQEKKTRDNWAVWKGPQLWTLVADLMNWNPGPSPDNIRALSWFGLCILSLILSLHSLIVFI
ncbi:hypothetical protein M422DRAFT_266336 [Sphaerobolus stellatus SS14]|uniref:Uncharacterized protein n=1 Tax=Sphaerobolus stellatus (strain SS14) TaxID=990650 RepID=A0A0C9UBH7_SPHS4|nr:hypothetical protein M422DRAFT_266336 [Sphaerobolus stellatus SS14]